MVREMDTSAAQDKGGRRIHAFQVYPLRLEILISAGQPIQRGALADRLTRRGVEDEIPHASPGETAMSTGEAPEPILEEVGTGAHGPVDEAVYGVFRQVGGELAPCVEVGAGSSGRDLTVRGEVRGLDWVRSGL